MIPQFTEVLARSSRSRQCIRRGSGLARHGRRKQGITILKGHYWISSHFDNGDLDGGRPWLSQSLSKTPNISSWTYRKNSKSQENAKRGTKQLTIILLLLQLKRTFDWMRPVLDENCRTCRWLVNYVLRQYRYPPALYTLENLDQWMKARDEGTRQRGTACLNYRRNGRSIDIRSS